MDEQGYYEKQVSDLYGDTITVSVSAFDADVWVVCHESQRGLIQQPGKTTQFVFTPHAARKLAKRLRKAARITEGYE